MYFVMLYDSRGAAYPSMPKATEADARDLFTATDAVGRFVKVELLYGNPIAGFTILDRKDS